MRRKIITDQNNFLCFRVIPVQQLFDFLCSVHACSASAYIHFAPPGQGFCNYKMYCRSIAFILKIILKNFAGFCWNRYSCFFNQLSRLFFHAYQRNLQIIRQTIKLQNILHMGHKVGALFWGYAPTFTLMRF